MLSFLQITKMNKYYTSVCSYFKVGCSNNDCKYAHNAEEIKPRMCRFNRYCKNHHCNFFHSVDVIPSKEELFKQEVLKCKIIEPIQTEPVHIKTKIKLILQQCIPIIGSDVENIILDYYYRDLSNEKQIINEILNGSLVSQIKFTWINKPKLTNELRTFLSIKKLTHEKIPEIIFDVEKTNIKIECISFDISLSTSLFRSVSDFKKYYNINISINLKQPINDIKLIDILSTYRLYRKCTSTISTLIEDKDASKLIDILFQYNYIDDIKYVLELRCVYRSRFEINTFDLLHHLKIYSINDIKIDKFIFGEKYKIFDYMYLNKDWNIKYNPCYYNNNSCIQNTQLILSAD